MINAEKKWEDLKERLEQASARLQDMRDMADERPGKGLSPEYIRLAAKASGVNLALSYMEEYER